MRRASTAASRPTSKSSLLPLSSTAHKASPWYTATIVPSVTSPSCLEYQVVGACYWLRCTNFGCKVKTSTKVRHYVPDAVVSSYSSTGENPWSEVRTLSSPISNAKGGGSGTTNDQHENNLSIFKNVDIIGHPGIAAFNAFASGSGYSCAGAGKPYVPNMLSTLDYIGWRHGIPESVYPQLPHSWHS